MELLNWILFGPAKLIAAWPYAGYLFGAALIAAELWLYRRHRRAFTYGLFREAAVFTGLLWMIFNAYERQVAATASASALRIDLVVLVPVLYAMTLAAAWAIHRQAATPVNRESEGRNDAGAR